MAVYLDASAIVKLIVRERESDALERTLPDRDLVTSAISRVEVVRAVARAGRSSGRSPSEVLSLFVAMTLDDAVLSLAASLGSSHLRTLDAIHLASALGLGSDLDAFVTYDERQASAASVAGLTVESPR